MSDNKFILQLKGTQTPKSVVEIKNDKLVAPFVNIPGSSDVVGSIIPDKDSSVVVAKGADVWKLDGGSLVPATNLSRNEPILSKSCVPSLSSGLCPRRLTISFVKCYLHILPRKL